MEELAWILYLLKVSASMALFYILYHFFLQKLTFFSINRFYLLSTILLSFLIPALQWEVERKLELRAEVPLSVAEQSASFPTHAEQSFSSVNESSVSTPESYTWLDGINAVYWLVAIAFLTALVIQTLLVFKHTRKINTRLGDLKIIHKSKGFTNCSFLNYVFVDAAHLRAEELEVILRHERVHADQLHTLDKLLVQLCKSFLWFNPFIYLYGRALEAVQEYEADGDASQRIGQSNYANLLLAIAVRKNSGMLLHSFVEHPLKSRINMLFKKPSKNMKKLTYLISLPVLAMLFWGFSVNYVYQENAQNVNGPVQISEESTGLIDSLRYRQKLKLSPELSKLKGDLSEWRESAEYKWRLAEAYKLGHGVLSGVVTDNPETEVDRYSPYLFITAQQKYVFSTLGMDPQTIARIKSMGQVQLTVGMAGLNEDEPYLSLSASKIMKDDQLIYSRPVPVQPAFLHEANQVRFTDGTITKISGGANAKQIEVAANGYTFLVKANSGQIALNEFAGFKQGDQVRLRFVHELKTGDKSYLIKDWVAISKEQRSYGLKNKQLFYRFYEQVKEEKLNDGQVRYSATDSVVLPPDRKSISLYGAVTIEFQDIKIEGTKGVYNKESMLGSANQVTVRDERAKTLIKADSMVFNSKTRNMRFFGVKD